MSSCKKCWWFKLYLLNFGFSIHFIFAHFRQSCIYYICLVCFILIFFLIISWLILTFNQTFCIAFIWRLLSLIMLFKMIEASQFSANMISIALIKFARFFQVFFGLFLGKTRDHFGILCFIWKNCDIKQILHVLHIFGQGVVALFTFIRIASRPSQMMNYDFRFESNKKLPQVFY